MRRERCRLWWVFCLAGLVMALRAEEAPPAAPAGLPVVCCEGTPVRAQGVTLVPLREAFGWFERFGEIEGQRFVVAGGEKPIVVPLVNGATNGFIGERAVPFPAPLELREDRFFISLRWVCDAVGATLTPVGETHGYLLTYHGVTRLLPLACVPYAKVGVIVFCARTERREITTALKSIRAILHARLTAQGVTPVVVASLADARKQHLPAVYVARYEDADNSHALELTCRDAEGVVLDWRADFTGFTGTAYPSTADGIDWSAGRRVDGVQTILADLEAYLVLAPVQACWQQAARAVAPPPAPPPG